MELWMLLAYTIGTVFGLLVGMKMGLKNSVEDTIDTLIEQKYLKTKGIGDDVEILRYTEWCNDKTTR
jgi:hypothetical protein